MATGVLLLALTLTTFSGIPVNRVYAEEQTTEVATETDAVIDMAGDDITYAGTGYDSLVVDAGETLALNATNFPDANFRAYLSEEFDTDGNGYIDPSVVTDILVRDKGIESLKGIEYFENLKQLNCQYNELTSIDLSKNTVLEGLDCGNNQLTDLDVSNNTLLNVLFCDWNKLTSIDVSRNKNLRLFWCSYNQISSLNVANNNALEVLYCFNNQLAELDVSNNIKLVGLRCGDNQLSYLDVSKNVNIYEISCQSNKLTKLDLSNNKELRVLYCYNNKLPMLELSNNTELQQVRCSNNRIISLNISNNKALKELYCDNNYLLKVDGSANLETFNFEPQKVSLESQGWIGNDGSFFYSENGEIRCLDVNDNPVINQFKCDGTYTYYFQADGTAMMDRLTYHPDGVHVIYFDEYGHEVFSDFSHVQKSIAGDAVDDYCFFDVNGYMYTDVLTYDKAGKSILYANPYGVLEHTGWFQFSDGGYGYANADATLMTDQYTYDWNGNLVYMEGDGHIRGTGDGRNLWPH